MNKTQFKTWAETNVIRPLITYVNSRVTTVNPEIIIISNSGRPSKKEFIAATKDSFEPFEALGFDINNQNNITYYQDDVKYRDPKLTPLLVKATIDSIRSVKTYVNKMQEGNINREDFNNVYRIIEEGKSACKTAHVSERKNHKSFAEAFKETGSIIFAFFKQTFFKSGSEDAHSEAMENIIRAMNKQFPVQKLTNSK